MMLEKKEGDGDICNNTEPSVKKVFTLVMIRKGGQVLLGYKKRGFGKGKWNGFGGKLEKGETVCEAAKREVKEECGLVVNQMKIIGILHFMFEGNPVMMEVHVFSTDEYLGEPVESDEMIPRWFGAHEIPFDDMWPDDRLWFPLFLQGCQFRGQFWYKDEETIEKFNLSIVRNPVPKENATKPKMEPFKWKDY